MYLARFVFGEGRHQFEWKYLVIEKFRRNIEFECFKIQNWNNLYLIIII